MRKIENKNIQGELLDKIEFRKFIKNGQATCILSLSEEMTSFLKIELISIEKIEPIVTSFEVLTLIGKTLYHDNPYLRDEFINDVSDCKMNKNVDAVLKIINTLVSVMVVPNMGLKDEKYHPIQVYREDINKMMTYGLKDSDVI